MLVVVLLLERLSYAWRILAHPVLVRIASLDQFGKHSHNTDQHFFAGLIRSKNGKSFGHSGSFEDEDDDEHEGFPLIPSDQDA